MQGQSRLEPGGVAETTDPFAMKPEDVLKALYDNVRLMCSYRFSQP